MDDEKREVNEYLFYEFGFDTEPDSDAAAISDSWPFELREVGMVSSLAGQRRVYEFTDEGEEYFAFGRNHFSVLPKAGMTLDDLRLQERGSAWIGRRDPVGLNTVLIGDDTVPPTPERRAAIERLAAGQFANPTALRVLEGLFLRATGSYLALVEDTASNEARALGTDIAARPVGFPAASAWRRLVVAVGGMLEDGSLTE